MDLAKVKSRLATCEEKIKSGVISVGECLKTIQEDELWKVSHPSFQAYCQERWGWSKSRVYQLIEASSTHARLSKILDSSELPQNDHQLRAVAKAPPEKQAEVVQKANERAWKEDRNATAKDFAKAVDDLQYDDVEDDDDEIEMPVQISAAELAVANAAIGKKIVSAIDAAKKLLRAVEEVPGTELLVSREKSIMRELDSARNSVLVTIPHSVCPRCHGKCCAQCGNMGWVNSVMADQLTA